jgi:hypothetical protein
MIWGNV